MLRRARLVASSARCPHWVEFGGPELSDKILWKISKATAKDATPVLHDHAAILIRLRSLGHRPTGTHGRAGQKTLPSQLRAYEATVRQNHAKP